MRIIRTSSRVVGEDHRISASLKQRATTTLPHFEPHCTYDESVGEPSYPINFDAGTIKKHYNLRYLVLRCRLRPDQRGAVQ